MFGRLKRGFAAILLLFCYSASAQEILPDHFQFESADYGLEAVLPTINLEPGVYIYALVQSWGEWGMKAYPDLLVIADPPKCGGNWNEHPFGARGKFSGSWMEYARGMDLFEVPVPCKLTISVHSNAIAAPWVLDLLRVMEWFPDFAGYFA